MAVVRMLIFLGVVIWMVAEVSAAPTKYDQRQEGNFNVHAKLENFLLILLFPSEDQELLTDFALQAVDLKQQLGSRSGSPKERESIISGVKRLPDSSSEPVVLTSENHENESSVRKVERENVENVPLGNEQAEKSESAERISKNMKSSEFSKSRQVPSLLGYLVDARNVIRSKAETGGRSRNVLGNPELTTLKTLEMSEMLKEHGYIQLLQREKDDVALPSTDADKNDMALSSEEKPGELVLLGGGIENCGPERHRDASGICQSDDKSADSSL